MFIVKHLDINVNSSLFFMRVKYYFIRFLIFRVSLLANNQSQTHSNPLFTTVSKDFKLFQQTTSWCRQHASKKKSNFADEV